MEPPAEPSDTEPPAEEPPTEEPPAEEPPAELSDMEPPEEEPPDTGSSEVTAPDGFTPVVSVSPSLSLQAVRPAAASTSAVADAAIRVFADIILLLMSDSSRVSRPDHKLSTEPVCETLVSGGRTLVLVRSKTITRPPRCGNRVRRRLV